MNYKYIVRGPLLGSGAHGRVYLCKGQAVKLTSSAKEAELCQSLVGHRMKYLVKIYKVQNFEDEGVWAIHMEPLRRLSEEERKTAMWHVPQGLYNREEPRWTRALKRQGVFSNTLVKNVRQGLRSLKRRGVIHTDTHYQNIMKTKDGVYKIIDLSFVNLVDE